MASPSTAGRVPVRSARSEGTEWSAGHGSLAVPQRQEVLRRRARRRATRVLSRRLG